jgi:3-oxoacyl-[acyl-carrier protein] reductase
MGELTGKVAIVTGASRGIGAATAAALTEAGAVVMLAARDGVKVSVVANAINAKGGRAAAMVCDVADYAAVERLVGETKRQFGEIDILVNNAGIVEPLGPLAQTDPTMWGDNIRINLIGPYHTVRAVLPHMLAARRGTVIQVSSPAAHRVFEGGAAYCAAKAGLAMLTRMIAAEYGNGGIRVFGVLPGGADTDMHAEVRAYGIPLSETPPPASRPAAAIRYLCTAAADDLAGTEVSVNDLEFRQRVGLA